MKWLIPFILLLGFNQVFSQTYAELSSKFKRDDAVVLDKQIEVRFNFNETTKLVEVLEKTEIRIMALNPASEIFLSYDYDGNSKISSVGTTPLGRYFKTCGDISPEGIFHSGIEVCVYKLNFRNPGEIITFKLTRHFSDVHYFNDVYFNTPYPVLRSINVFYKNDGFDVEFLNYNTSEYSLTENKTNGIDNEVVYQFTCTNIPGRVQEANGPPVSFLYPHTLVIPREYKHNGKLYPIFQGIDGFYQWCKGISEKSTSDTEKLQNIVNEIIAGKTSDIEKMKLIFSWVQDKIRYIAFEEGLAGFVPEKAEVVCENKFGDCKGMANLLKTMLSIAGIDARLTWVGTSDIPYDFSVPSLVSVNHMVCTAIIDGNYYVLDATNKYCRYDQSAIMFQGRQVLIEDGKKYILYRIPGFDPENNLLIRDFSYVLDKESLKGAGSVKFHGLEKNIILDGLNTAPGEGKQKIAEVYLTNHQSKIKSDDIKFSDITNKEQPFEITGKVEVNGQIFRMDNEIFIHPDVFEDYNDYFIGNDRMVPYYFNFPQSLKTIVNIEIPDGYKPGELPKNTSIKNEFCNLEVKYSYNQNKIVFEKKFRLLKTYIPKSNFQEWNDFFKQYKKACSQQIVLTH